MVMPNTKVTCKVKKKRPQAPMTKVIKILNKQLGNILQIANIEADEQE